jgi:hypothetical protein
MHTVAVVDLPALETTVLGPGPWHEVSQQHVNQFAGPKPAGVAQVLYRFFGPTGEAAAESRRARP